MASPFPKHKILKCQQSKRKRQKIQSNYISVTKKNRVPVIQDMYSSTSNASFAAQESCEKWRLRGNQAYAKGDFLNAEDCYTLGIDSIFENKASKTSLKALLLCYSDRATARMSLGRMREASKDCMKAVALDPNCLKVQIRAGSCYVAIGDVENASLRFITCLQAGPGVCADTKLMIEASEGLVKIWKVADCINQASALLGRKTSNDTNSAIRLIIEALSISSYSDKLLQLKVDALLMLNKYEDLIQFCEQLLSVESNFVTSGAGHSLDFHSSDLKSAPSFRIWCCTLILMSYFYLGKLDQALVYVEEQEERCEIKSLESMIPLVGTIRELLRHKAIDRRATLSKMIRDYGQAVKDLQKIFPTNHPGPSDKTEIVFEFIKARLNLLAMEEAATRKTPLNMYLILGIDKSAASSDIRKAYLKAALKCHPDKVGQPLAKNKSQDGIWKKIAEDVHKDAGRLFKMIGEANAVLSDHTKRSRYDEEEELIARKMKELKEEFDKDYNGFFSVDELRT